jgi:hypothetical protein
MPYSYQIQAMIALHRDEPAKGVELLASAAPYERAYPDAIYARGLAYLRMNRGRKHRLSFRKSWISRAPIGERPGPTRIGDSATRSPIWEWPAVMRLPGTQRVRKNAPGLLRTVERRRPRHSRPQTSQSRVCEVELMAALERPTNPVVLLAI